jgi:ankyrin repeat protein
MEENTPPVHKGYQKQIKKAPREAPAKPKAPVSRDYASPMAKKWPALLEAIESDDAGVVHKLINEGLNVNVMRDGVTPLMIAASRGRVGIVEAILQAGVNINERTDEGWTALHKAAVDQQETAVVDLLLHSGIAVDAKNKFNRTALQLAEEKNHREIVRAIKKFQAGKQSDAQEWEKFLRSPEGRPYQAQQRFESLDRVFRFFWVPLPVLAIAGLVLGFLVGSIVPGAAIGLLLGLLAGGSLFLYERQLRSYLDSIGPLPHLDLELLREKRRSGEPILTIRRQGSAAQTSSQTSREDGSVLTMYKEEPVRQRSPLPEWMQRIPTVVFVAIAVALVVSIAVALHLGRHDIARWYFQKKIEWSGAAFTEQAFLEQVAANNAEQVDLFIRAGMGPAAANNKGTTAVMVAADHGHADLLAKLVEIDRTVIDLADTGGMTALMTAVRKGREPAVQKLLTIGANVNLVVPGREGAASALQVAADTVDPKEEPDRILQVLLQHGAEVNARNAAGRDALSFAVARGRVDMVRMLLDHGAEVNGTDQKGTFALFSAACEGNAALVALLAEKGADMTKTMPDGQTPILCAVQADRIEAVKMLLEKGAPVNASTGAGATAIIEAASSGKTDIARLLLQHKADPSGYVPGPISAMNGATIQLRRGKTSLASALTQIANTAARDGYTVHIDPGMDRKVSLRMKGPWNKVLLELAAKQQFLPVVKEKDIFCLPYVKAAGKHKGR